MDNSNNHKKNPTKGSVPIEQLSHLTPRKADAARLWKRLEVDGGGAILKRPSQTGEVATAMSMAAPRQDNDVVVDDELKEIVTSMFEASEESETSLEDIGRVMGHDRYMRRLEKDEQSGRGLFLDNLMKLLVEELPEAEKQFAAKYADWSTGKGRRPVVVTENVIPYLMGETPKNGDYSAAIREYLALCMTAIADGIATPSLIQSVMVNAGEYILAQINARLAEPKLDDQEWRKLIKEARQNHNTARGQHMALQGYAMQRSDFEPLVWDAAKKAKVAKTGIGELLKLSRVVTKNEREYVDYDGRVITDNHIMLTDEARQQVRAANWRESFSADHFMPTLSMPNLWDRTSARRDGSKPYEDRGTNDLIEIVRRAKPAQRPEIQTALESGAMDDVVSALNVQVATPYVINTKVYAALRWAVENDIEVDSLPDLGVYPLPDRPTKDLRKSDLRAYRHQRQMRNDAVANQLESDANLVQLNRDILFIDYTLKHDNDGFHVPMNLDHRGRFAGIPSFNFQRGDTVRGLFLFKGGKPIEDAEQLEWLYNQAAVEGDFDKMSKRSWNERQQWVKDNMAFILAVGKDYQETAVGFGKYGGWGKADHGFQFLAACIEIYKFHQHFEKQGWGYICRLPSSQDGSNSGCQHYSALSLRTIDAARTNLQVATNDDRPEDGYNDLADRVWAEFDRLDNYVLDETLIGLADFRLEHGDQTKLVRDAGYTRRRFDAEMEMAKWKPLVPMWRLHFKGRKHCKPAGMVYAYTGTVDGVANRLDKDIMKPLRRQVDAGEIAEHPFGSRKQQEKYCRMLASIMMRCVADIYPGAAEGMRFLKAVHNAMMSQGMHMHWTTPDGFPAAQYKVDPPTTTLDVAISGGKIQFTVADIDADKDLPPNNQSVNSFCPNYIHSMDATALRMALNYCAEHGVHEVMTVHDSFAASPADCAVMYKAVRLTFRDLYSTCRFTELLQEQRERLKAAGKDVSVLDNITPPEKGELSLRDILQFRYAFA